MSIDIKNVYLNKPLKRFEYLILKLDKLTESR